MFLRMTNVADKSCRGIQNTHFMFIAFLFRKSGRLWNNGGKYCRTKRDTDDYYACVLHAGYLRLRIHARNMWYFCFSIATMVERTCLSVMLYVHVHCLSYYSLVLSSSYRAFVSVNSDFITLTYSWHGEATDRYKAASLMTLMSHRALCVCVCVPIR